jgi:hypothetical protein
MSNVLIGIIGVILFIGLALAGALILGDDFRSASNSTLGATLMSQIKQAADAAEMRRLKLGVSTIPSTGTEFLVPRFLKTAAVNPTPLARANPGNTKWTVAFNNNLVADGYYEPVYAAKFAQAVIGPENDAKSRAICLEIAQSYGQADVVDVSAAADPVGDAGCALSGADTAVYPENKQYIAFVRVAPRTQSITMLSNYP